MIDIICSEFREAGYQLYYNVVEATDFGVPQKRKRVILVGWDTWRTQAKRIEPESFWAAVTNFGGRLPTTSLRNFVTNSMEGAHPIPEAFIPGDFSFVKDELWRDALTDCYKAVEKVGQSGWNELKDHDTQRSFMYGKKLRIV